MATDNTDYGSVPSPAERAAKAQQRVEELQQRRLDLAAGIRCTAKSVAIAQQRAREAKHRAEDAHLAASLGHNHAADVHESTANALQQALMLGCGDPRELQDRADNHWQAADENRRETAEELIKARLDSASRDVEDHVTDH